MLELRKTHDTTITIDDEPIRTHIKRLTKAEAIAFERGFFEHGKAFPADLPEDEKRQRSDAGRKFLEDSIAAYVSVAHGQIVDDGRDVTSGEDLIRTFCARADVLGAFYQSIYTENFLGKAQKKILSARSFFAPGSTPSTPTAAGDGRTPTAGSAESSSIASDAAATDGPSPASSGRKVH